MKNKSMFEIPEVFFWYLVACSASGMFHLNLFKNENIGLIAHAIFTICLYIKMLGWYYGKKQ